MKNMTLNEMRKKLSLIAYKRGATHIASAFSCLEIIYALFGGGVLRLGYDRFILSKGHGSLALYVNLMNAGFFDEKALDSFARPDSILGGEPRFGETPGVEATTGSLGHGLSQSVGRALANKMDGNDRKIYVLIGDGECQEGSVWEAVMSAVSFKLGNLITILDYNRLQKMDTVENTSGIADWLERFSAFGWDVTATDGHNLVQLIDTFRSIRAGDKPHLIVARTIKGKGVSLMENNPAWHWKAISKKDMKVFASELGISDEEINDAEGIH